MSLENAQLIEDGLRIETALNLLSVVDPDSITHVNSVDHRREAQKRLRDIRQQLTSAQRMAHNKAKRLFA
jgi:hypothetical protein